MKKMMKNMSRNVALGMAALTLVSTIAGTSANVFAAEPESEICVNAGIDDNLDQGVVGDDVPEWAKESGKALINKSIGMIPVVGNLSDAIAPLINSILGLDGGSTDQASEMLKEISSRLGNIEMEMDDILVTLYEDGKLQQFNIDMTDIRNMTISFFNEINTIQSNPDTSDAEKALEIGALLQTRSSSVADFTSVVDRATSFLIGNQVVTGNPESICVTSYNAKCDKSLLGSEVALKNAAYINNVTTILANAYKLEALVVDSKIVLAENMNGNKMSEEEKKALAENYKTIDAERNLLGECKIPDKVNNWKIAAGVLKDDGTYSGIKGKYDATLNTENPNSCVAKYNKMVTENWYSYIKSKKIDGRKADIVFQPIRIVEGKDYSFQNMGGKYISNYDERDYGSCKNMINEISDKINKDVQDSGLTPEETSKLIQHVASEPFCQDKVWNLYPCPAGFKNFEYLGFGVHEAMVHDSAEYGHAIWGFCSWILYEDAKPVFVTGAKTANFDDHNGRYAPSTWNTLTVNYVDPSDGKTYSYTPLDYKYWVHERRLDNKSNQTYHRYLWFEKVDSPVECTGLDTYFDVSGYDAEIEEALRIDDVASDMKEEKTEDESIVLTVDENGQITGDQMNDAWTVAEDGTIILNKDNKFRFEGTVADKNIQNNGEIVDGNFKNVKLELVDNAVITKGTFEDCEITTNENAVIGEEVEFINTTIIDAKDIGNEEEEEQKEEQKDNPQDVVEETPVVENDMF